jgi:hypothetical protein
MYNAVHSSRRYSRASRFDNYLIAFPDAFRKFPLLNYFLKIPWMALEMACPSPPLQKSLRV